ncbi:MULTISPECIES: LysE family translocator [unclassified Nocardioides]|uniref:LysE family translocator n=1 Tax=unclassified Nocardioides TaxID=2615069 RepID=UPI0009F06DA5|nr:MULTISPECIES: LysE family translocator [unclassified Nocardioides]GAW48000.1 Lysine exporter protein LysE/YggA [Nocardioides sp. PD653-B2]GAW53697.1 Lysine exporter protein LysE/YggA [Nocardioides sp. PD653]
MIPPENVLPLVGVILLGALTPGPDFVVLTRRALASGRRAGLICATGMGSGIFVWVVAVGGGLAALLAASAIAFTVVKLAGAAYLLFLGVRAWLSSLGRGAGTLTADSASGVQAGARSFREGALCNLLNPKVAVFYLALLPQFVAVGGGPLPTLELALLATTTVTSWYLLVALIVASVRRVLQSPRVRRVLDATVGTVLIGLGLRIATT